MALLIKSTGEEIQLHPNKGNIFTLRELQTVVDGYIEVVQISKEYCMIINEEGKLISLPKNEKATRLYQNVRYTDDFIVGDVLICNNEELK